MSRAFPRFRRDQTPLPPLLAASAYCRFSVWGLSQGQTTITGFSYHGLLAWLSTTLEADLAAAWEASLKVRYLAMCNQDFRIFRYGVSWYQPTTRATVFVPGTGSLGGAVVSTSLDSMLASVFTRTTGLKTACGRGRAELPAVPSSFVTAGESFLNGAGRTQAALTQDIFAASLTVAGNIWTPCLISHGTRLFPSVLGAADVTDRNFDGTLGTIRRRKLDRGI